MPEVWERTPRPGEWPLSPDNEFVKIEQEMQEEALEKLGVDPGIALDAEWCCMCHNYHCKCDDEYDTYTDLNLE